MNATAPAIPAAGFVVTASIRFNFYPGTMDPTPPGRRPPVPSDVIPDSAFIRLPAAIGLSAGPGDVPPRRPRLSEKPDAARSVSVRPLTNEGYATATTPREPATARNGPPVGPAVAALMRRGLDRHQAELVAQRNREAFGRRHRAAKFRADVAGGVRGLRDYLAGLGGGSPCSGLRRELDRLGAWLERHGKERTL